MINKITCILLFSLLSHSLFSQAPDLQQRIDLYFQEVKSKSPAPGFAVVVVKDEKVIFEKGYGVERLGDRKAMSPQTSSAIGSLTKSITSLSIMQLVEKGLINLDEKVIKYIPEFRTANKDQSDLITVRMLLNNSSGLQSGISNNRFEEKDALEKFMETLTSYYIGTEVGSSYQYSNAGYSIAGLLIERVTGISYSAYLEQNIFNPLKMITTTNRTEEFGSFMVLYGHHLGRETSFTAKKTIESPEMSPAGSLLRSSASDLGNYLIMLLNNGMFKGTQIITKESIEELWTPQIAFPGISIDQGGDGKKYHYGLGWMISDVDGRKLIHHGGSRGTMSSMTIIDPEKKLAASILFNIDYNFIDPYQHSRDFYILNNLFHLINGENISSYGLPVNGDPTINNYKLSKSEFNAIIGSYLFSGKGDKLNLSGTELQIFENNKGELEGKIIRAGSPINQFELDFVNKVNALTRNNAKTVSIKLKVNPYNEVTSLFYGGSEYYKREQKYLEKVQTIFGQKYSFQIPNKISCDTALNNFTCSLENYNNALVKGGVTDIRVKSLETLISKAFQNVKIEFIGSLISESVGQYTWIQQSFKSESDNYYLVILNNDTGFYAILKGRPGNITLLGSEIFNNIMTSYSEID